MFEDSIVGPLIIFAGLCYVAFNLRQRTAIPPDYMQYAQYPVSSTTGTAGGKTEDEIARNLAYKKYEQDKMNGNPMDNYVENTGNVNKGTALREDVIV
jgi:hypothetical protein